ncbi:hypothetical protein [Algoriphagus antarcticus]|uniref:Uncharacterized protein n=1 Tax=Algoriphagus antarcticus TaxID=238540 RepID=A0A3E0DBD4_9BACT|nr:hypothetical protein [Algoriphagus antarcticus]REG79395.1 hypothetical protein C8N25_13225 [Algoriphagus antarcticus]
MMKKACLLAHLLSLLKYYSCNKQGKSKYECLLMKLDSNIAGTDFTNQPVEAHEYNII